MKILKPGKVEMRKFVCQECGCIFEAYETDTYNDYIKCPQDGCGGFVSWNDEGAPYEEPTQTDGERLARILFAMPAMDDCNSVADYLIQHGVTLKEG